MEPRDPMIGERVMIMRRRRGLSQRELAAMAQMSTTALNRLENGLQSIYAERLATLARVLDVSTDYLLGLHAEDQTVPHTGKPHEKPPAQQPPATRSRSRKAAPVG